MATDTGTPAVHKQAPARAVGSASRTRLLVWGAEAQPYAARAAYTPEARCGPTGLVVSRDASHASSHSRAETATAAAIQSTPRGSVDGCAQAHLRTCWPPTCCVCSKRVPKTQARTRARRRLGQSAGTRHSRINNGRMKYLFSHAELISPSRVAPRHASCLAPQCTACVSTQHHDVTVTYTRCTG